MNEFDPIILHRVQPYLMEFSVEHGVVVPAACGFPTLVSPPVERLGNAIDDRLELKCPTCADIHAENQRAKQERLDRIDRLIGATNAA